MSKHRGPVEEARRLLGSGRPDWAAAVEAGRLSRRHFLALSVAGLTATALRCGEDDVAFDIAADPFRLGVASGDPLSDRVVLWTRLAPDPSNGGGMPDGPASVLWEVAADPGFSRVVRSGLASAHQRLGHSVHVDVAGLEPDSWYWYRFRAGVWDSPVGRTRTLPAPDSQPEGLRFAVASCQNYKDGFYTAYAGMVEEDLDLVLFLGDYIYETGPGNNLPAFPERDHDSPTLASLVDYRNRYALYRSDPNLRAAHAAFPWLLTWDDHEVQNNYADLEQDQTRPPVPDFAQLRTDAYLAYYEHMPMRILPPKGPDLIIHRHFTVGDLLTFYVADTRQFRTDQPCGDETVAAPCAEVGAPGETMLGDAQEAWLFREMGRSETIWNVLAQQVVYTPTVLPGLIFNQDQWDGYPTARQRINDFVATNAVSNFVVLSGDIHASGAGFISPVATDATSGVLGAEFVATGISSGFPEDLITVFEGAPFLLDHIRYATASRRGYLSCRVTRDEWQTDFRGVETTLQPVSSISTLSTWGIAPGALDPVQLG